MKTSASSSPSTSRLIVVTSWKTRSVSSWLRGFGNDIDEHGAPPLDIDLRLALD